MTKDQALRLALEALESGEKMQNGRLVWIEHDTSLVKQAITAVEAALEAKNEPVAWRDAAIRLGEELSSVGPNGYYDMDAKEWLDWAMEQNPRGKHSLPQRKPLTLGQKQRLWSSVGNKLTLKDRVNSYGLAIEAAHGIKVEA